MAQSVPNTSQVESQTLPNLNLTRFFSFYFPIPNLHRLLLNFFIFQSLDLWFSRHGQIVERLHANGRNQPIIFLENCFSFFERHPKTFHCSFYWIRLKIDCFLAALLRMCCQRCWNLGCFPLLDSSLIWNFESHFGCFLRSFHSLMSFELCKLACFQIAWIRRAPTTRSRYDFHRCLFIVIHDFNVDFCKLIIWERCPHWK